MSSPFFIHVSQYPPTLNLNARVTQDTTETSTYAAGLRTDASNTHGKNEFEESQSEIGGEGARPWPCP